MSTLEQLQYGFDRDSRRTWQRRSLTDTQDQQYNYDALSQVSAAARGSLNLNMTAISGIPASAQSWDYDPTGNWRGYHTAVNGSSTLDQHRVHDRGNRMTQIEDNPNNMILDRVGRMRQMAPDAGGDWDGKLEVTWDAWSRITSVKNNGTVVGSYTYDGSHRRVTRVVGGETLHSYYNETWRPVEERKGSATTASTSYLWGARHRDDLVRSDRATSGTTLNETRYVLMDYFNPAAVTDAAAEVKERYAFSAFGVRTILNPDFTIRSSSECGMEFGFQGQFLDEESGLMNYGYRYYSPPLGRWTCKDPIGENGGLNLYAFVDNSAPNGVDLLGTDKPRSSDGTLGNARNKGYIEPRGPRTLDNFTPPFGPNNGDKVDNKEWYDRNRGDEIRSTIGQFKIEIERAIRNKCSERVTTVQAPEPRQLLPRNVFEGNYVNGTVWMNVRSIQISWDCEHYSWGAEMFISDGVGFDKDPNRAGWFERNVQYPIWGTWLTPPRDIERGTWPMNGDGYCY